MKLSEDPDYLDWSEALASRNFNSAHRLIDRVRKRAEALGDDPHVGLLWRCKATTFRLQGDIAAALNCYLESEKRHASSLQPKLQTIEFLLEEGSSAEALSACNAALRWFATSGTLTDGHEQSLRTRIEAIRQQLQTPTAPQSP